MPKQPKKKKPRAITDPLRKRLGEASEAAFLARATRLGLHLCRPWGESERYDLVIDHGRGFWRVQVKCTERYADKRYRVKNAGNSDIVYTPEEIDFVAAHVIPLDLWYIIPVEAAGTRKGLRFYPHNGQKSLFEKYREAWCLLTCPRTSRGRKDLPTGCRSKQLSQRCSVCPLRK